MNPNIKLMEGCLLLLLGIVFIVSGAILVFIASKFAFKEHLTVIVITTLTSLVGASFFLPMGIRNVSFFTQFQDTKNKLDGVSLSILAHNSRGLIFVEAEKIGLSESAVRYLISLQLIKSEVFPESLDYGYFLTDLGRFLLEDNLRFKLYPKSFCNLIRVRYWQGDKYKAEFSIEKDKFEKDWKISWDKCWEIFGQQMKKEKPQAKDDTLTIFRAYLDEGNSFNTIMDKIVKPWLGQTGIKDK